MPPKGDPVQECRSSRQVRLWCAERLNGLGVRKRFRVGVHQQSCTALCLATPYSSVSAHLGQGGCPVGGHLRQYRLHVWVVV